MVSPWKPRLRLLPLACAVLACAACRTGRIVDAPVGAGPLDVPADVERPRPPERVRVQARAVPVAGNGVAAVEPGVYASDPRFELLADAWPTHVAEALTLLDHRAGLAFREGPPVRVVLVPLRDEAITHRIATRVVEGRRQAIVQVNAEPLVAGVARADTTIGRALAEAVFELVALRHEPVAPWVVAFAGSVTAGDLELELARLHRDAILGVPRAARVDPDRVDAAQTTGLAVLALLQERELLDRAPDLLRFARQGEDPAWMLTRLLREADASWVGPARSALEARRRTLDAAPWQRLRDAEQAWRETGRGGLEAALTPPLDETIRGEAKLLRIRAALEEGDWAGARTLASSLTAAEEVGLREPAALLAIRAEIESRPDGDGELAREWLRRLTLDFPASEARASLRDRLPLLGSAEDPSGWLAEVRAYMARRGTDALDLPTLARVLRVLLVDHRAGAAAALVDGLGARAEAPELERVVALVNEAQSDPTPAAVEASRRRLEAWVASPSPEAWTDVADGGRAAWGPTLAQLGTATPALRVRLVRLLAAVGGVTDTLRALAPTWRTQPRQAGPDLDALAARVDGRVLRRVLFLLSPALLPPAVVEQLWFDVSFRLDAAWLDAHPTFLTDVRGGTYPERRQAFDTAVQDGAVTPELVGFMARDPAAVLRAEAMRVAGREGFAALASEGLGDASPLVRSAAARAVGAAAAEGAARLLMARLEGDPASDVQVAAADALLALAPRDPVVLDALVATQARSRATVRDRVGALLLRAPRAPVALALARAARAEMARRPPRGGVFARYVLVFQRISGENLGFVPGLSPREHEAIANAMQRWARRAARGAAVARGDASADDRLR